MTATGPLIETGSRSITDQGLRVQFSPREWSVLTALIDSPSRCVSALTLSNMIWGDDAHLHTVASVVNRMRRKLAAYGITSVRIRTIRHKGYAIQLVDRSYAALDADAPLAKP